MILLKNIKINVIPHLMRNLIQLSRLLHSFFIRNDVNKITLFLLVVIGVSSSTFAQNSNKKRVLVIPPSRFEFVSEFDLEVIAKKNETTVAKVFLIYEKTLLNSFENYQDENFEFVPVEAAKLQPFKKQIKYKYGKFNGKHYNAVDLKGFNEVDFTKLLEGHNADFIIFITWYDIQKEAFSRKHSKRVPYAGHYLDYDIYNLFKQHIYGAAKIKAEANKPNDLEASFSLLRTKELESAYHNFIGKIVVELNKPIEQ
ncbi:MAG: hypothetical protein COA97_01065 [Flavobacteriales bacterium]|nr:MAG: hypothetical protein COA97_01065 [Flavobacteriales bacterium]